jgi:hypothetical protein
MGLIIKPSTVITWIDNTDLTQSVALSATVTLRTYTGKGTCRIVTNNNGNVNIQVLYAVDGGADTVLTTSDIRADASFSFQTSLVIKVKNLDGAGAHPSADVSSTGGYQ